VQAPISPSHPQPADEVRNSRPTAGIWAAADAVRILIRSDQIRSGIGLLRVDKRNSTIDSRNDTRNNVVNVNK